MFAQDYENAFKTRNGRLIVFDGAYVFRARDWDIQSMDGKVALPVAVASFIPTHEEFFLLEFPDATLDERLEMRQYSEEVGFDGEVWGTFEDQLR